MELLVQSVFTLVQLVGSSATDLTEAVADMRHPEALVYRLGASVLDLPDERQALLEERCLLARSQAIVLALSDLIALSASHMGAPTSA